MAYKANRPNVSSAQRPNGQQSNSRQNFQQSSARDNNDFVEFSYKDPDEFLKKSEEFARKLAGDGEDLGRSQLRKFYDQVINLRDKVLRESLANEEIDVDDVIFRLKLLQARVIYLANRKANNKNLISPDAKKYLFGILERGITLCKDNKKSVEKALNKFTKEFEAIYAYFYGFSKSKD
ncbi:MAG TPA: type III-A CRISPR-associated protein Csm2 [Thermodesulfobium narugense]|nr:MAG: type III-A CRISPR-associated protein Csm2 [Thermodesulfobium narugense]HEM55455.1 type III-A CRISPR-associated protein Csm2 [Thermodesulfobium narugense]